MEEISSYFLTRVTQFADDTIDIHARNILSLLHTHTYINTHARHAQTKTYKRIGKGMVSSRMRSFVITLRIIKLLELF